MRKFGLNTRISSRPPSESNVNVPISFQKNDLVTNQIIPRVSPKYSNL